MPFRGVVKAIFGDRDTYVKDFHWVYINKKGYGKLHTLLRLLNIELLVDIIFLLYNNSPRFNFNRETNTCVQHTFIRIIGTFTR